METKVVIEQADDKTYACRTSGQTPLKNGINGYGKTAEEAKKDFLESYAEAVEHFDETPDVTFTFAYDTASFLQTFGKKMSLTGLQAITGINRKQLSHYLTGHRKPSARTVTKIEKGIRQFQKELSHITFV